MKSILGVVLAGGKSTRMGQDKAQLLRHNETMLSFTERALKSVGIEQVVVSGERHGIADTYPNLGPLSGIYSVLGQYQPDAMLIVPVDLPLIDHDTLKGLLNFGLSTEKACSYHQHSLPLFLPNSGYLNLWLTQRLKQSSVRGPSFKELFNAVPSQQFKAPNEKALSNCNTVEQWQRACRELEFNYE